MDISYKSTRSDKYTVTASEAILQGLAPDGGLFVPSHFPVIQKSLRELSGLTYKELALEILSMYLTDYTEEELQRCIDGAYDDKFDTDEIAPLKKAGDAWFLELFHGPTIAFKDMALSILPYLMTEAARKNGVDKETVILTATSGDTGKAALAGFAGVKGTRIVVYYPKDGVSRIQERQMVTQTGENTCVIGIRGNFDDAQNGVKKIFTDSGLKEELDRRGFALSSANSINVGRLVPQVVYYVHAYCTLLRNGSIADGEKINFVVPTGNFGNILAAFLAMKAGVPVGKLICASNTNKVLYDFFCTGEYDRNREFVLTSSPSLDILISSNLERLIYHICGQDPDRTAGLMRSLSSDGRYEITPEMKEQLDAFYAGFATEEDTAAAIRDYYEREGYVIDPHTAVAASVYAGYRDRTGDNTKTVIASTASPFKFETSVLKALSMPADKDDLELAEDLSKVAKVKVPEAVLSLKNAPVRHTTVCSADEMKDALLDFLK